MHVRIRGHVALALALACVAPAHAGTIEDVEFAESVEVADTSLSLSGLALLRYRVLFKGYVAGLYLPSGTQPVRALEDVPKRLELEYFWSIEGQAIAEAGDELLRRNVDAGTFAALGDRLRQINALYEDVEPGDRYALSYAPGVGTELSKNGRALGVIPGADFAKAYFSIWLGNAPLDESFRDQLFRGR
ncbi:MAG: chalcone isomerase family protein [Myxococcota bacterium]